MTIDHQRLTASMSQETNADASHPPAFGNPIVFQCKHCSTIIGDSIHLMAADSEQGLIVLSQKSSRVNMSSSAIVQSDEQAFDYLCSCFPLSCVKCQTTVGRFYKTVTKAISAYVEKYIFDVSHLECYELGSVDPLVDFSFNMASSNALLNQIMQTQQFEFKTRDMVLDLTSQVKHYEKHFKTILLELKEMRGSLESKGALTPVNMNHPISTSRRNPRRTSDGIEPSS